MGHYPFRRALVFFSTPSATTIEKPSQIVTTQPLKELQATYSNQDASPRIQQQMEVCR
jgi:hypothetical protein